MLINSLFTGDGLMQTFRVTPEYRERREADGNVEVSTQKGESG